MAAGKNKLLSWTRLVYNGYDISGDTRTFSRLNYACEGVNMGGLDELIQTAEADKVYDLGVEGVTVFMNDTALSGAFTLMKTMGGNHELSVLFGSLAEPAFSDPAYLIGHVVMGLSASVQDKAMILTGDLRADRNQSPGYPWGHVLYPETTISSTTTGTAIDNGAATTLGYYAHLHVMGTSAGNFSFKVRHSADNVTYTDLGTFGINGSAIASAYLAGTSSVNRYVRFEATRTAGSATVLCTFARRLV